MGGGRIILRVLRLRGIKFFFKPMTHLYLLKIVFPKFDPLTVIGMALCVDLGPKCHILFCLV
jgi:hypothetical protein